MRNFGYLNPATCYHYDVDNNLITNVKTLQLIYYSINITVKASCWV